MQGLDFFLYCFMQRDVIEATLDGLECGWGDVSLLKDLSIFVSKSHFFSERLIQLCYSSDQPDRVIPLLCTALRFPEDEKALLDLYKDLIESDRSLLLPIIQSLSSIPLSAQGKKEIYNVSRVLL